MMDMLQILVIGYNSDAFKDDIYGIAYETGKLIVEYGAVLITGGLGGVMEAASKGAYDAGGITVGIIPYEEKNKANPYCKIVICSGMGHGRNYVNVCSADGVIIVGGGVGTLTEAGFAYMKKKPIIAIKGSGGIADSYGGKYLDDRELIKIEVADTPREAVEFIIKSCKV